MGKCKFNETWMDRIAYRKWLKPVKDHVYEAFCILCKKRIQLGTMGQGALDSHAKCGRHRDFVRAMERTPSATTFTTASTSRPIQLPIPVGNEPEPEAAAADTVVPRRAGNAHDLRSTFGSTPTLKAQTMWVLQTVAKHNSYNSNEGISDVFRAMFPDSDIASKFSCRYNKTAYIAKFGLAVFIKAELIAKANKSAFVLMFDESLNESTKTKQLVSQSPI